MPTIVEPQEPKPQLVPSAPQERELFAAEVAMEDKSSSVLPLLFVASLIVVVGGVIYFFIQGANARLTAPVATTAINEILKSQPPAEVKFSTGTVTSSVNEKPLDPHYKLLAKAGILVTRPKSWNSINSTLTPAGEKILGSIAGVEKATNKDGTVTYAVPLAQRQLVSIDDIKMSNPHLARVQYSWKWVPNRLGQEFDASSDMVKGFTTWDRQTLINRYGVNFYSVAPTKASIFLMQTKNESWKPYVE